MLPVNRLIGSWLVDVGDHLYFTLYKNDNDNEGFDVQIAQVIGMPHIWLWADDSSHQGRAWCRGRHRRTTLP